MSLGATTNTTHPPTDGPNKDAVIGWRERNSSRPALQDVPVEIWEAIAIPYAKEMRHLAETSKVRPCDLLALSQVCHDLRCMLLSSHKAWTIIYVDHATPLEYIEAMVSRVGPLNINFTIRTTEPYGVTFYRQLEIVISKLRSLNVQLDPSFSSVRPADFRQISHVAEKLEHLILEQPDPDSELFLPNMLANLSCPNLKSLALINFTFEADCLPALGSLTRLEIVVEDRKTEGLDSLMLPHEVLDMLGNVPDLEHLELQHIVATEVVDDAAIGLLEDGDGDDDGNMLLPTQPVNYDDLPLVSLPRLRRVHLANEGSGPSHILRHIFIPAEASIDLFFDQPLSLRDMQDILVSVDQKLRGPDAVGSGQSQILTLALIPADGGNDGITLRLYDHVVSLPGFWNGSDPHVQIDLPSFADPFWMHHLLAILPGTLSLSAVEVLYVGDLAKDLVPEADLLKFLRELPMVHSLGWLEFLPETLPKLLLTDRSDVDLFSAFGLLPQQPLLLLDPLFPALRTMEFRDPRLGSQCDQHMRLALKVRNDRGVAIPNIALVDM